MERTVSISEFGREVNALAEAGAAQNVAGFLGIVLCLFVTVDAMLAARGAGIPGLGGAAVAWSHSRAQSEATDSGDEAARLTLHSGTFLSPTVWVVVSLQAGTLLLGVMFVAASRPSRWLSEWLRLPRNRTIAISAKLVFLPAAAAIAYGWYSLWSSVIPGEMDAGATNEAFVSARPEVWLTLGGVVFLLGLLITSTLAARRRHLRFVFLSVLFTGVAVVTSIAASRLIFLGNQPFEIRYGPFTVFRAIDALLFMLVATFALLWMSNRWCSRYFAESFRIVPTPGDAEQRIASFEQSAESELPRIWIRFNKDQSGDYRPFLIMDEEPRRIAVPLEYNRWHEFEGGELAVLRAPFARNLREEVSIELPGGLSVSGAVMVMARHASFSRNGLPEFVSARGRASLDFELVQLAFEAIGGSDQQLFSEVIERVILHRAGDTLVNMMTAIQNAGRFSIQGMRNALDALYALHRAPTPPTQYGPTASAVVSAQALAAAMAQGVDAILGFQEVAIRALQSICDNEMRGTRFAQTFFTCLIAEVSPRSPAEAEALHNRPKHEMLVEDHLLTATVEQLTGMYRISARLHSDTSSATFALHREETAQMQRELKEIVDKLATSATAADAAYQAAQLEGMLERMRQEGSRFSTLFQAFSSPTGSQMFRDSAWAATMRDLFARVTGSDPSGIREGPEAYASGSEPGGGSAPRAAPPPPQGGPAGGPRAGPAGGIAGSTESGGAGTGSPPGAGAASGEPRWNRR